MVGGCVKGVGEVGPDCVVTGNGVQGGIIYGVSLREQEFGSD